MNNTNITVHKQLHSIRTCVLIIIIYFLFFWSVPPNLFLNGDDVSSLEDIRKWTMEDVYTFIHNIPSCSEYAQVSGLLASTPAEKGEVPDNPTLQLIC